MSPQVGLGTRASLRLAQPKFTAPLRPSPPACSSATPAAGLVPWRRRPGCWPGLVARPDCFLLQLLRARRRLPWPTVPPRCLLELLRRHRWSGEAEEAMWCGGVERRRQGGAAGRSGGDGVMLHLLGRGLRTGAEPKRQRQGGRRAPVPHRAQQWAWEACLPGPSTARFGMLCRLMG